MTLLFNVQGMTCGHCVRAATQAIQTLDPQAKVEVNLAQASLQAQTTLSAEQVIAALAQEGYQAQLG